MTIAAILPIRTDLRLNDLKLKPMSENFSPKYFKQPQTISRIGMLYPKLGIRPACGKTTTMHMEAILISMFFTCIKNNLQIPSKYLIHSDLN